MGGAVSELGVRSWFGVRAERSGRVVDMVRVLVAEWVLAHLGAQIVAIHRGEDPPAPVSPGSGCGR
jgi:hypothetical protein